MHACKIEMSLERLSLMSLLRINFSTWYSWARRKKIPHYKEPGVYAFARFKKPPKGKANPLDKSIIYFGETCSSLGKRLYQFEQSAFRGKRAHSGGSNYRKKHPHDTKGKDLYVAAMPVTKAKHKNKDLRESLIRFLERKAILDFTVRYKKMPECNRK